MIMDTACQVESDFSVRNDGVMVLSCDVNITIGYRVVIDGSTGKVSYQPFVGQHVSPFAFPSIDEAQDDALRMVANVIGLKGLITPEEDAIADMEYHVSVICALAGIAQEPVVTDDTEASIPEESPFSCDEEVVFGTQCEDTGKEVLLDNTYATFSLRKYLEKIEPGSLGLDEVLQERYSCLCQIKGDRFIDLETDLRAELRLYHYNGVIWDHLRMVFNGGVVGEARFRELVGMFLTLVMNVHFYGVTDQGNLLVWCDE